MHFAKRLSHIFSFMTLQSLYRVYYGFININVALSLPAAMKGCSNPTSFFNSLVFDAPLPYSLYDSFFVLLLFSFPLFTSIHFYMFCYPVGMVFHVFGDIDDVACSEKSRDNHYVTVDRLVVLLSFRTYAKILAFEDGQMWVLKQLISSSWHLL